MGTSTAPNIIFIFADQHRHDALGCAGNPIVQTPHIDALASQGTRFSNTWCQSPVCQPSRASMITSKYPHELDILRNFGRDLDPQWPNFMHQLKQSGYNTANIGKTHYYSEGLVEPKAGEGNMLAYADRVAAFGFDHVVEEFDRYVHAMNGVETHYTQYLKSEGVLETYQQQIKSMWRLTPQHWDGVTSPLNKEQDLTSFLTREAAKWIDAQTDKQPFFLQLSYVQPHVPLMGDPEWAAFYENAMIPRGKKRNKNNITNTAPQIWQDYLSWCDHHAQAQNLDDEYVLKGAQQYYAMISLIDECVGSLVKQLKKLNIYDNTLIVYSSDHGEMLGDQSLMAKFTFYKGSVQIPLIVKPPSQQVAHTDHTLTELVDVAPTLLDYAQAEPLQNIQGVSLKPLIENTHNGDGDLRTHQFSEIQVHGKSNHVFCGVRDKTFRFTLEKSTGTPCELYNLEDDPHEQHNLVHLDKYKNQVEDFSKVTLSRAEI